MAVKLDLRYCIYIYLGNACHVVYSVWKFSAFLPEMVSRISPPLQVDHILWTAIKDTWGYYPTHTINPNSVRQQRKLLPGDAANHLLGYSEKDYKPKKNKIVRSRNMRWLFKVLSTTNVLQHTCTELVIVLRAKTVAQSLMVDWLSKAPWVSTSRTATFRHTQISLITQPKYLDSDIIHIFK